MRRRTAWDADLAANQPARSILSGRIGPVASLDDVHYAPPWQFFVRATAVITGLTLLLFADVHGVAFYVAWSLIVLALVSEGTATLVYWRRTRAARGD